MCLIVKESGKFEGPAFELVDETEKGGAKIVFRLIERRLTIGANRRCRSGAVSGDEKSERTAWTVTRRGSVRVERPVRQNPVWERDAACPGTLTELGFEKELGWSGCGNHNAELGRADGYQAPKDLGEDVMPNDRS